MLLSNQIYYAPNVKVTVNSFQLCKSREGSAIKILGQVFVVLLTKSILQNLKCNQILDARQKLIDKTKQTFKTFTHGYKEKQTINAQQR